MNHIIKWDPFKELADIQGRLSSLFARNHQGDSSEQDPSLLNTADWAPAVDITEDDHAYEIIAELPDVDKDKVKVTTNDGYLTITGEREREKEESDKKKKYHRIERSYGKYERSFRLPDEVAADKVKATFKNGVLKLTLPKSEEKVPKHLEINID